MAKSGSGMDRIRIVGGCKLNGTIPISGAKNAALPLMIAGLLSEETLVLDNVPRLADVAQLQRILGNHGVDITSVGKRPGDHEYQGQTLHISAANIIDTTAPYELVSRMRASFWVIAPLLARMHEARVSLPGGCAIGTRPVDLLIMALEKLGADIAIDGGYVVAKAPGGPNGARPELLQSALDVLTQAGAVVTVNNEGIRVARNGADINPVTVSTAPFPGFPTDLQAQLMSLMPCAKGTSRITETIFENRFMHVQELARLGAHIRLDGECATIEGVGKLTGAPVMATDLRASVSLVIAALAAEGETMVNRVYHLDRGFERLEDKLSACGAAIERISG